MLADQLFRQPYTFYKHIEILRSHTIYLDISEVFCHSIQEQCVALVCSHTTKLIC